MYLSNFNFKKKIYYLILFCLFNGCYRTKNTTSLKLKDNSDIVLYEQDSAQILIYGSMKEWNNFIYYKDNALGDSNYIKYAFKVINIDSIIVEKCFIQLFYIKDNRSIQIEKARIYYDANSFYFDDYHQYRSINDTFKD